MLEMHELNESHLELLLTWRNSEIVRHASMNQSVITEAQHKKWFEEGVKSEFKRRFIVTKEKVPIGFVYFFDIIKGESATWGFFKAPESQRGSGRAVCNTGLEYFSNVLGIEMLNSYCLIENKSSIKLHENLGFRSLSTKAVVIQPSLKVSTLIHYQLAATTLKLSRSNWGT